MAKTRRPKESYVICVHNKGYPASLEVRKLYRAIRDESAAATGMLRVVDESGEDYLYPAEWFIEVELTAPVKKALAATG